MMARTDDCHNVIFLSSTRSYDNKTMRHLGICVTKSEAGEFLSFELLYELSCDHAS